MNKLDLQDLETEVTEHCAVCIETRVIALEEAHKIIELSKGDIPADPTIAVDIASGYEQYLSTGTIPDEWKLGSDDLEDVEVAGNA